MNLRETQKFYAFDIFFISCAFNQEQSELKILNAIAGSCLKKDGIVVIIFMIRNSNDFFYLFILRQINPMIWVRTWIPGEKIDRTASVERRSISDTLNYKN